LAHGKDLASTAAHGLGVDAVSVALGRTDRNFPSALALTPQVATTAYAGDINGHGLLEIFIGGVPNNIFGTVVQNAGSDSFSFAANTDRTSFMVADRRELMVLSVCSSR
jgi:hypothetical protein